MTETDEKFLLYLLFLCEKRLPRFSTTSFFLDTPSLLLS